MGDHKADGAMKNCAFWAVFYAIVVVAHGAEEVVDVSEGASLPANGAPLPAPSAGDAGGSASAGSAGGSSAPGGGNSMQAWRNSDPDGALLTYPGGSGIKIPKQVAANPPLVEPNVAPYPPLSLAPAPGEDDNRVKFKKKGDKQPQREKMKGPGSGKSAI